MKLTGILVKVKDLQNIVINTPYTPIPPPPALTIEEMVPSKARKNFLKFLECKRALQRYYILSCQSGVSKVMFNEEHCKCYCSDCWTFDPVFQRGGMTYHVPIGFTRFALRVETSRHVEGIFSEPGWPVAYHGTTFHNFKHILHSGLFVPVGARGPDGTKIGSRDKDGLRVGRVTVAPSNPEENVFFTPLLSYASHPVHASPTSVTLRGKTFDVSVVFQLRVRPGSYTTGKSTLQNYKVPEEEKIYRDQEEWYTARHGCVIPYGVLMTATERPKVLVKPDEPK